MLTAGLNCVHGHWLRSKTDKNGVAGGSLEALRGRGELGDFSSEVADDQFMRRYMKNIKTVKIDPPTEEEMLAARKRRAGERAQEGGKADGLEIPEDHPFASSERVAEEDDELIKARMKIKRGMPLQDLDGTRGYGDE